MFFFSTSTKFVIKLFYQKSYRSVFNTYRVWDLKKKRFKCQSECKTTKEVSDLEKYEKENLPEIDLISNQFETCTCREAFIFKFILVLKEFDKKKSEEWKVYLYG